MIVMHDLKGYSDQAALPYKHQTLMDDSVEVVDGNIVLKFKKFLVEKGENEISASQNSIYTFYDTVGEGHG